MTNLKKRRRIIVAKTNKNQKEKTPFFKKLYKPIDKIFVTPITKFILLIGDKTGKKTGKFEKWLVRRNTLIFISLILALGLFFIVDSKAIVLVDSSAEVLYDQKVEAIYNSEDYVIEGLPKTVDVTLIGRKTDMYLAKQLSNGSVTVDVSKLGVGTHKVSLNYDSVINSIDYKLDPGVITIIIYPKTSIEKTATIDVINKDKLDPKLSISNISIDTPNIIVKGAEHTLNKVASVKALVDIEKLIDPTVGVTTLEDVKLVAYDSEGKIVDVEMVPNKVTATISIESPSKEVPIKVIPKGEVEFGKAISSMTSSVSKVTVYGDEEVLDKLEYIPIEINVTNLKGNKNYDVIITPPSGIRSISEKSATISVSLGDETSMEVNDVLIETINLDSNYKAVALGENSSKTSVVIKGTKDVLDTIDTSNIKAVVDLSGYGEGDYEVPVTVKGDDAKANYTAKTTKIKIRISPK